MREKRLELMIYDLERHVYQRRHLLPYTET